MKKSLDLVSSVFWCQIDASFLLEAMKGIKGVSLNMESGHSSFKNNS